MKFLKNSLCRYIGKTVSWPGGFRFPFAIVSGIGPTKDSSRITLITPSSFEKGLCVSDDLLEATSLDERIFFYGETLDMFDSPVSPRIQNACIISKRFLKRIEKMKTETIKKETNPEKKKRRPSKRRPRKRRKNDK